MIAKSIQGDPEVMSRFASLLMIAILLSFCSGSAFAAALSGEADYRHYCARCHGKDGKGHGPDADEVAGYHAADLTQIIKNNHGKFPRQHIYDVIDGGTRLPGHYSWNSPMPLWGMVFQLKGKQYSPESEASVKARISALVDYIESVQTK
jgi:mono/diheme cytochrome c family protein